MYLLDQQRCSPGSGGGAFAEMGMSRAESGEIGGAMGWPPWPPTGTHYCLTPPCPGKSSTGGRMAPLSPCPDTTAAGYLQPSPKHGLFRPLGVAS